MKLIKLCSLIILLTTIISCSSDNGGLENNNLTNFTSQICNGITGPSAIYWDYSNGIPAPLNQIPVLPNPGQQFIHSQHPYLGFIAPQGYTATEDRNQQTSPLGVNVIRNDNAAIWRYVPLSSYPTNFSVNDIIGTEINQMFNFYNFNGDFDVLCTETRTVNQGGLATTFSARLLRFGNFTGLVYVNVTFVQGLPTISAASSVSAGPTNEYNNLVMDTFLPLSFQLLVSDRETLSDRDNDGAPDIFDNAPDDPKVQ